MGGFFKKIGGFLKKHPKKVVSVVAVGVGGAVYNLPLAQIVGQLIKVFVAE